MDTQLIVGWVIGKLINHNIGIAHIIDQVKAHLRFVTFSSNHIFKALNALANGLSKYAVVG
jgi:hypothetical protein